MEEDKIKREKEETLGKEASKGRKIVEIKGKEEFKEKKEDLSIYKTVKEILYIRRMF